MDTDTPLHLTWSWRFFFHVLFIIKARARNCDQYSRICDLSFPFATKISGEVANLRFIFPQLFRNKKVTTHKNCGLIFCFAKPPRGKCSAKSRAKILRLLTLRLKVARLCLNFGILSQDCDWNFSLILSPVAQYWSFCFTYKSFIFGPFLLFLRFEPILSKHR